MGFTPHYRPGDGGCCDHHHVVIRPIRCSAVCQASSLAPLHRVLRQCSICIMGLFRTVALDFAPVLASVLSAKFQIWRQLIVFYFRQNVHGKNVLSSTHPSLRLNGAVTSATSIDILEFELRHLHNFHTNFSYSLSHIETRRRWHTHAACSAGELAPFFSEKQEAVAHICVAR